MSDTESTKLLIGYEVGTRNPVDVNLAHLFISGLTQQSGKTTSLEGFINRIHGFKILVFRTGRGEITFDGAHPTDPFFRERTDWQFVEGLISAHLLEKAKTYRADIIRASTGAQSLQDFWDNIQETLNKTKVGTWTNKVCTELDQYLSEIVPELKTLNFSSDLFLEDGVNVMDLEMMTPAMQQLVISASIDRVMEDRTHTIVVLPEARDFIPQDRKTPAKLSLENLIRKGAKLFNFLWLDSQSLTGLDMDVMRSVGIWLYGRQDLDIEAQRVSKAIPLNSVKPQDIQALKLGQFYLVEGMTVKKVYVQPKWMSADLAMQVADGTMPLERIPTMDNLKKAMAKRMQRMDPETQERIRILEQDKADLAQRNQILESKIKKLEAQMASIQKNRENKAIMGELKEPLKEEKTVAGAESLEINLGVKETQVNVKNLGPVVREYSTETKQGQVLHVLIEDRGNALSSTEDLLACMVEYGWN